MSDIIHLLPDHVANQIAAGEVVQRPASVVKELLENAIDANATIIKLLVKDAGKTSIQVIDNGKGMSVTDARLSFERHATSKISKATDLFNLQTKGFRGEALASIAAIAHVELRTKQEQDEVGTSICIEGSKVSRQEPVTTPTGTSIAVKNLFYNIPARRNFLKSDAVETRHIVNELQRVALAHPAITFFMYHNDHEVYHLKTSNLKQRIVAIFGKKTNEKLVPIQEKTPILSITGFVAKPEFAKKSRGEQFFFVNNRFIKTAYLNHAVKIAFEGLIANNQHPTYFLFLEVPTESVDINIHPTKTEVKFENEKDIYAIIRATVKHSLGQYNVAPVLDFNRDASMDTPYSFKNKKQVEPGVKVDRSFNPFIDKKEASWESLYVGAKDVEIPVPDNEEEHESTQLFTPNEENTSFRTQQLHTKYIVSTIKSGMVFIHQNRAHERVLYETYLRKMTVGEAVSQQLLFPIKLAYSNPDMLLIKELQDDLESIGFVFENKTNEHLIIKGVPSHIEESEIANFFEDLIQTQKEETPHSSFSQVDQIAKTLAKSCAIKLGKTLTQKEQEELVNSLFICKEPNTSPFGKACFTTITIEEINKRL
ncbi:MAG TPA: DNA mismatch repair endonuclease MutL [Lutibacter sp.]|nr:DNA mismatch repair endonuclease MutL [Lutibacter sp.]